MNQPKFKFGDKVLWKECDHVFTVRKISQGLDGHFHYSEREFSCGVIEGLLELYQEPQKKKLYAIQHINKGTIEFCENAGVNNQWMRRPEYDIGYPEAN